MCVCVFFVVLRLVSLVRGTSTSRSAIRKAQSVSGRVVASALRETVSLLISDGRFWRENLVVTCCVQLPVLGSSGIIFAKISALFLLGPSLLWRTVEVRP